MSQSIAVIQPKSFREHSPEKPIARPKPAKEYACPTTPPEMKLVANLKEKYMEMKESRPPQQHLYPLASKCL